MTVLPAPRRVIDGKPGEPLKRWSRPGKSKKKSVSVRATEYLRWQEVAIARGLSMSELVELACASIPEPEAPR